MLDIVPQTVAMACEETYRLQSADNSTVHGSKGLCFGELSLERCVSLCGCVQGPVLWRAGKLCITMWLCPGACVVGDSKVCVCVLWPKVYRAGKVCVSVSGSVMWRAGKMHISG